MSALWILAALIFSSLILQGVTLAAAGAAMKYRRRGFGWALLVVLVWHAMWFLAFAGRLGWAPASGWSDASAIVVELATLAALFPLEWFTLRRIMKTTWPRAIGGWGLALAARLFLTLLIVVQIRPRLLEAYAAATASMAPTLLDAHAIEKCPRCGGRLLVDLGAHSVEMFERNHTLTGFCLDCRRESELSTMPVASAPDHFMVTKILTPQRWDLVSYHSGNDIYVKRVIGLPGEELRIDADGRLFVNRGSVAGPPGEPGILFPWPEFVERLTVRPDEPIQLGPAEYFVVGDLAERSLDSRSAGPVKAADIDGVVTWIYWPLDRMRIVR